jgi:hypothetical protein
VNFPYEDTCLLMYLCDVNIKVMLFFDIRDQEFRYDILIILSSYRVPLFYAVIN